MWLGANNRSLPHQWFPLKTHSSGRYHTSPSGKPFFIHGDSIWEAPVRASLAQWQQILDDRVSRGFNTILLELIEHRFNSVPTYRNVNGDDPFTTMSPVAWSSPNAAYWDFFERQVYAAEQRGVLLVTFPAFYGFTSGTQGWDQELAAAVAGDLQTYGDYLGQRFGKRNVLWVMGGDNNMDSTSITKMTNILTGIQGRDANALWTAENDNSTNPEAVQVWSSAPVNATYSYAFNMVTTGASAYARSPAKPFWMIEDKYENETVTYPQFRQQFWSTWLTGGCGHIMGCNPLWSLGDPNAGGNVGQTAALVYLGSTGSVQRSYMTQFVNRLPWTLLVPKTDTTLVTSSLTGPVCPALASDGSFGVIWKNNTTSSVTVNMAAITAGKQVGFVNGRWYDPTTGVYSTVSGSPWANSGTQVIAHPGSNAAGDPDWVLLLE